MHHFNILGPPTIAFYGPDGEERQNFRVVGYMKANDFASLVTRAIRPTLSASIPGPK
jgi:thioredoxin:protein disulfide reductase